MLEAKSLGSGRLKPLSMRAVWYTSFAVCFKLSLSLSWATLSRSSLMMGCLGLISSTLLPRMYACLLASERVCDCMIFSMLALHPYLDVTTTQGVSLSRLLIFTESTLS
ncbi:Os06g0716750, partial [Oryza sativa Japonica Group]